MPVIANRPATTRVQAITPSRLVPSYYSRSIYGDFAAETDDLLQSIRDHGILVSLVVAGESESETWEVISGHRRLACAIELGLPKVPCEIRSFPTDLARRLAILEYNRQRQKNFSQTMREADAIEELLEARAKSRRLANLRRGQFESRLPATISDCRNSDDPRISKNSDQSRDRKCSGESCLRGRTDARIAQRLGLGGKDLYRQARAVWRSAQSGDTRAKSSVVQLDAGTKTIFAAYKDLRRATASVPTFDRHPMTSGHFGMTVRTVSATPGRFLRRSLPTRFTTTLCQTLSSLIQWLAAGRHSMSVSRWDVVVWRTTSSRSDQRLNCMTFVRAFRQQRLIAT